MTGSGNNTYLLASAGAALLVDAGTGERRHLADLQAALERIGATLDIVAVTHGDRDHASGAAALAAAHRSASFVKHPWPEEDAQYGVHWSAVDEGDCLTVGNEELIALRTPGHSPDHLAFWHEPSGALYTGDLVVAGSSVMIHASRGGSLRDYMASLERVLVLAPRVLYPAHGERIDDPAAVLTAYLAHRRARERQIVEALRAGHAGIQAIAESIYHDLDAALMPAARENVRAHLEKLQEDGVAVDEQGRWHLSGRQGHGSSMLQE